MRKLILAGFALLTLSSSVFAWGVIGHQSVVVVAERHLNDTARKNLDSLFGYPLRKDASWMDAYRKNADYAFTGSYHTMAMNHEFIYDPSWRITTGGDCVTGLRFVEDMLSRADVLDLPKDSYLLYSRMVFHIVGDMHCLSHSYVMPERNQWNCTFRGQEYRYHGFLDHITDILYEGMSIDEIAAKVDTFTDAQIQAFQKGTFEQWAQDCCTRDKIALDVNPYGTKNLDPATLEKLGPAVDEAIAIAGYRLALLLNRYFGTEEIQFRDGKEDLIGSAYDKNGVKGVIWKADLATRTATVVSAWISAEPVRWCSVEMPQLGGTSHNNGGGDGNIAELLASKVYKESGDVQWAFTECLKKENGFDEGWYMPARYELNELFDAYRVCKEKFDESMKTLGSQALDSAGEGSGLWSSTVMKSGVDVWICRFVPKDHNTHKSVLDGHYYVRCMKKIPLY